MNPQRFPCWLIIASLGVFVSVASAGPDPVGPAKPNIVLIYADDLGYGDVGCYGATQVRTPNIDRLAAAGLRFTDAHTTSATCTPSRYALLSGQYPWRKKGTSILPGDASLILPLDRTCLPGMLKAAGYATAAIGKWHLGLGEKDLDWNREIKPGPREVGFDYSFLIPATADRVPCVYVENQRVVGLEANDPITVSYRGPLDDEPTGRSRPDLLKLKTSHGHDQTIVNGISRIGYMHGGKAALWVDETIADTLTQKAIGFLERSQARPFFLYFATHDIHVPRAPHERFAGKTGMGPRGDVIGQLDSCVGEILATLERLHLSENTLVIFSSDNGPVVDDGYADGAVEKLGAHRPAGPFRGGKYSLFEGGTRVPLIVRWPGHIQPGVSNALVSQIDFLASFSALTGQALEEGSDSSNQLRALLGQSATGRESLIEHAGTSDLAVRVGSWKFIPAHPGKAIQPNTQTETGLAGADQLYDLAADPGEKENLAGGNPEKISAMRGALR